jgi:hypothetical protein
MMSWGSCAIPNSIGGAHSNFAAAEKESRVGSRQQQVIICNINDQQLQNKRLLAIILVLERVP